MKAMIKVKNGDSTSYIVCPEQNAKQAADLYKEWGIETKIFGADEMPLEELPEEIIQDLKDTLKAFDTVYVNYEFGKFEVTTCICIRAKYGDDHFCCGTYKAEKVFTKEERRQNFKEEFGYIPFWLK